MLKTLKTSSMILIMVLFFSIISLWALEEGVSETIRRNFDTGKTYYDAKQFRKAIDEFGNNFQYFERLGHDDDEEKELITDSYYYVACSMISLKLFDKAFGFIKQHIDKIQKFLGFNDLAKLFYSHGRIDYSIAVLEERISAYGDQPSILWSLGYYYLVDERYEKTIECGERAYRLNSFLLGPVFNAAEACIRAGRNKEALRWTIRGIENQSDYLPSLLSEAISEYKEIDGGEVDRTTLDLCLWLLYTAAGNTSEADSLILQLAERGDIDGRIDELLKTPRLEKSAYLLFSRFYRNLVDNGRASEILRQGAKAYPSLTMKGAHRKAPPTAIDYSIFEETAETEMVIQQFHTKGITSMTYTPDGKYLLTASGDKTVKLWNSDNRLVRTFYGNRGEVSSIDIHPSGKYFSAVCESRDMKMWHVDGRSIGAVNGISLDKYHGFSRDGRLMARPNPKENTIGIIDLLDGRMIRDFPCNLKKTSALLYTPDMKYLVLRDDWKTLLRYSLEESKAYLIEKSEKKIGDFCVSPNSKYIVSVSDTGVVRLRYLDDGTLAKAFVVGGKPAAAVFHPEGEMFAVGTENRVSVFTADTGALVGSFTANNTVNSICFHPSKPVIVCGGRNSNIEFFSLNGDLLTEIYQENRDGRAVALSPEGEYFVTGDSTGKIGLWNRLGKLLHAVNGHTDAVVGLCYSSEGCRFLSSGLDKQLCTVDLSGNILTSRILDEYPPINVDERYWFPGRRELLSIGKKINIEKGETVTEYIDPIEKKEEKQNGKTTIDMGTITVSSSDEIDRLAFFMYFLTRGIDVLAEAVDPTGRYVVSSNIGKHLHIWSAETGEILHTLNGHSDVVMSAVFSPSGESIASGSLDHDVILWDVETGRIRARLKGHRSYVNDVVFSHNGKIIASGSADNTIKLWSVENKRIMNTLHGHTGNVNAIAFSRDDKFLYTVSSDTSIRIWNLQTGACVTLLTIGNEWICFTEEGYFDCSPNGGELVAMVRGLEVWNIDQFAVRNNRPDIIIQRLGIGNNELVDHYYQQYQKRLRRLGLTEEDMSGKLHVPDAYVREARQVQKWIELNLFFHDDIETLKSFQIYINDVPLFGTYGKPLDGHTAKIRERVELSAGKNKIEVSCMNSAGAESFRDVTYANYDGPVERDLYYIGFGVSEYRDESLDLRYAHKDAEDLGKLFESFTGGADAAASPKGGSLDDGTAHGNYRRVITRIYTDTEVTRKNIAAAKALLEQASVDDTVVLMISGHGVHDRDEYATYYYLTHETDLDNLAQTAVEFEELEELLQGIPPRQKLFLMDTCGSGEWDPETARKVAKADEEAAAEDGAAGKGVWSRMPAGFVERGGGEADRGLAPAEADGSVPRPPAGGGDTDPGKGVAKEAGAARTYLADKDRYIYNDLVRRSGAIVFSSCRGDEVSYESAEYENGLFTEYIIQGLSRAVGSGRALGGDQGGGLQSGVGRGDDVSGTQPADTDGDGVVTTEELRQYVRSGVAAETGEDPLLYAVPQHPTVDRDNIYVEFGF